MFDVNRKICRNQWPFSVSRVPASVMMSNECMIPVYNSDSISIGFQCTFRSEGGCSTGWIEPLPSGLVVSLAFSLGLRFLGSSNGVDLGVLAGALNGLQV